MSAAIETSGLGKRYRLGTDPTGYDTLRDAIRRAANRGRRSAMVELWALRQVTLSVDQGEALGIIGSNGAGKTTLLKVLAGITDPTCGEARTRGRAAALLEVGTGLHPELTGRENMYLIGAILGMRRAGIRRRFDDIAEFAAVERFLDTPVKRYSSGMRLRLAFAVAAHVEPPVVLVDEVLAVGDAAFREKCLGKISELEGHGRTVLFVSHDVGAVSRICSRAIWLEEGEIRRDGRASEVISEYLDLDRGGPLAQEFDHLVTGPVAVQRISITDPTGRVAVSLRRAEPFTVKLQLDIRERVNELDLAIWLSDERGVRIIDDAWSDRADRDGFPVVPGEYEIQVTVPGLLPPRSYAVGVWIEADRTMLLEQELLSFRVAPRVGDGQDLIERPSVVQPELQWSVAMQPQP